MSEVLDARRRDRACACRATKPSGCASGPGARPRSPRSAASRPTTTAWTAPSRASAWREVLHVHRRDGEEVRPALRERVPRRRRQPASADPVRRQRRRRAAIAPSSSAPKSSSCASRSAAPSPASTASASRRSTRCACSSARTSSKRSVAVKRAFDPRGAAQSRQGGSDAARAAPSTARMHVHGGKLPHPELPRF